MAAVDVVGFDDVPWGSLGTHREYFIEIKTPLRGREGALDNFRLTFNRGLGGTESQPRHRHNFDQIRMPLVGRVSYGLRRWIEPGDIGYFPEGLHYGPTVDERDIGNCGITLQFGGASGLGYLSSTQMHAATRALEEVGTFEKGLYRRRETDGVKHKAQDAFEAMWEHVNGRRIEYPKPRYTDQIVMRPASFPWQAVSDMPGVAVKKLGDFTERHVTFELLRVEGGVAVLGPRAGILACLVLDGSGTINGTPAGKYTSVKVEAGAIARLESKPGLELVIFGLPAFGVAAPLASAARPQRETVNA